MFKKCIGLTPLTTDDANVYFQNIQGGRFNLDNSFVATLRALVAPRMKENERIYLCFHTSGYSGAAVSSVPAGAAIQAICGQDICESSGNLVIHSLEATHEDNLANLQLIESKFQSCYPGYNRLEKVRDFYRKSFAVDCYINAELKNVVVFVDSLDLKKLHYLQVSILAFLPWYFNSKDGVSELEMELLYSLRETTSDKYERCIAKIAEQYDLRTSRIRKLLCGFETNYERLECEQMREGILACDENIDLLNDQIGEVLHRRNEFCIKLLGLERKIADGGEDSEIMEYFLCNNKLYLEEVTKDTMSFCVKGYLEYFDPEMAESVIGNARSYIYRSDGGRRSIEPEDMKKLMTEIFLTEKPRLRIRFCAAYQFNLNGSVNAVEHHTFPMEFADYMPNTHIDQFGCMGNYVRTINQLLKNRDYIGALEQCVASCKSLNFGDSAVLGRFMATIYGENNVNNHCIELPDGRVVDPVEAICWLKEQENNHGQETEEA